MDDRAFAELQIDVLYCAGSTDHTDRVNHTDRANHTDNTDITLCILMLLDKNVKFQLFCDKLKHIDPVRCTALFETVCRTLYLYLHPSTVYDMMCDESETTARIRSIVEKRNDNRFTESYSDNYAALIRAVHSALENVTNMSDNMARLYRTAKIEKSKLDGLVYYDSPMDPSNHTVVDMFDNLTRHDVQNHTDAFNFIARLKTIQLDIHNIIQYMEKQRSFKGVVVPNIAAQRYVSSIKKIMTIDPKDQPWIVKYKAAIDKYDMSLKLYDTAIDLTKNAVYRALHHLIEWVNEFFLDDGQDERDGQNTDKESDTAIAEAYSVCIDKNKGAAYYKYIVQKYIGSEADVDLDALYAEALARFEASGSGDTNNTNTDAVSNNMVQNAFYQKRSAEKNSESSAYRILDMGINFLKKYERVPDAHSLVDLCISSPGYFF
jgi:hypothetical protein